MSGDSPEVIKEAEEVAEQLIRNPSIRRLAENPLLLTMLLVVKSGAGRLPPDRVSLYARAVEVLLDTWNIKGHAPLNPREAVPQLACVAYQMMQMRKQTVTEKELLALLELGRDRLDHVRRYAKDTPYDFLKRVELRSSLMVEAGHQIENGKTVPFYQFRHLTFQEYLAAVAAAEGHYVEYQIGDNALTPLQAYLTSEEWKEVVPMTAVLARKQSDPIIAELIRRSTELRQHVEQGMPFPGLKQWTSGEPKLPGPVARLTQCLIEEAEVATETLPDALQLVAFFGRGLRTDADWRALINGPYAKELIHQARILYDGNTWPEDTWLLHTCSLLTMELKGMKHWTTAEGVSELAALLRSRDPNEVLDGLLIAMGALWSGVGKEFARAEQFRSRLTKMFRHLLALIEKCITDGQPTHLSPAFWVSAFIHRRNVVLTNVVYLDAAMTHFLYPGGPYVGACAASYIRSQAGRPRASWKPKLNAEEVNRLKLMLESDGNDRDRETPMVVAYHHMGIVDDPALGQMFLRRIEFYGHHSAFDDMLEVVAPQLARDRTLKRDKKTRRT